MSPLSATRIDRYVLRQLMVALVATTGGLATLIWLTQSLRFVALVVDRGLSLRVFVELTSLLIPGFVAVILPITTFVVVQFVYQRLSSDRELTVMRAAGLSSFGLARPALACAAIVFATCLLLDVWVVPASYHEFRTFEFEIRNRLAAFLLQEGVFNQVSDKMTVYVRARDPDGQLRGILVEDDRNPNSRATVLAERGRIVDGPGDVPVVLLQNGSRQEIDKSTGRLNVLTFAQNAISLAPSRKGDNAEFLDATEMSIPALLHPDPRTSLPRDRGKFLVEATRRVTAPFNAVSYALVALVSMLTGGFTRNGNAWRPLIGIGTVLGLIALGLVVQNLAASAPALLPLIWVVAIAPGIVAGVVLFGAGAASRAPVRPARLDAAGRVGA